MTQVIEIVVIGPTGSGKSHVLEILANALRGAYGLHAQIASHELSLEKNLGHELAKPRVADTIFNLREQCPDTARSTDKVEAIQGQALSFMLDPLEQAIESTARVLRDEHDHLAQINISPDGEIRLSPLYRRMSSHFEALLAAQLKRVSA